jgi:hypothetical protein
VGDEVADGRTEGSIDEPWPTGGGLRGAGILLSLALLAVRSRVRRSPHTTGISAKHRQQSQEALAQGCTPDHRMPSW